MSGAAEDEATRFRQMLIAADTLPALHVALSEQVFIRHVLPADQICAIIASLAATGDGSRRLLLITAIAAIGNATLARSLLLDLILDATLRGDAAVLQSGRMIRWASYIGNQTRDQRLAGWADAQAALLAGRPDRPLPPGHNDESRRREAIGRAMTLAAAAAADFDERGLLLPSIAPTSLSQGLFRSASRRQGASFITAAPALAPAAPRNVSPPHLFVGIFGQWRHAYTAIPSLARFLDGCVPPGTAVTTAVATWAQTGVRTLSAGENVFVLYERLPHELQPALETMGFSTIDDFRTEFPTLAAHLLADERNRDTLSLAEVSTLLPNAELVDIEKDEVYLATIGHRLSASLSGDQRTILNQGRMWHRIEALGRLAEEAEARKGPIGAALLVRADLAFAGASLLPFVQEAVDAADDNVAWVDFDPYATFLEGLGDRYMVLTRPALVRIVDAIRVQQQLLDRPDTVAAFQDRLFGHQLLGSLLFQHGTSIRQVGRSIVPFDIDRGRLSLAEVKPFVEADAAMMDSGAAAVLRGVLG